MVEGRKLTQMDPGAFLSLVARCGLNLQEVDLNQLARHRVVAPWTPEEGERCYTELHLYVVAEYLEAVRPVQHPWGARAAIGSVDAITALNSEVNRLLTVAFFGTDDESDDEGRQFLVGLERFLARINPFGPLTEVFDLVRPQVMERMHNGGRLYLAVKLGADELSKRLGHQETGQLRSPPRSGSLGGTAPPRLPSRRGGGGEDLAGQLRSTQVIGEALGEAPSQPVEEGPQGGVDAVVDTDTPAPGDEGGRRPEGRRESQRSDASLGEQASSETIVLVPDEADAHSDSNGDGPVSLEAQIAQLNSRRRTYMRDQSWGKLAALYEEKIDLFSGADERRQVFLSLGMLYETKLAEPGVAFEAYGKAWAQGEPAGGPPLALMGLLRVGVKAEGQEPLMKWLDEELEAALDAWGHQLRELPQLKSLLIKVGTLDLRQPTRALIDRFLSGAEN